MARNGLSKREAQAAKAGGSLNYKTGKISLPRSLALKTPIQRISQAQKSQPIATDTGKQFGPFVSEIKRPVISQKRPQFTKPEDLLPKPTVVKNPLAKYQLPVQKPQKPKIKKTESEKYIESLNKPDLSFDRLKELPSDGVKETKTERKASEIHAAIEAIRPATKSINYAGSIENKNKTSYTKDLLKIPNVVQNQSVIASRPKGMSKREFAVNTPRSIEESQRNKNKVIDTPYEIGKGVLQGTARDLASGQLSVASGIQKYGKNKGGFTGRLAEIINRRTGGKSPTFNPSKYGLENVFGKEEVGTLRSELKKTQSTLPEGPIKSIAAPVAVYGGFASNFFGGASKGVTKGLVKNLAQETSESVIKNILKSTSEAASRLSDEALASLSTKIAHASDEEEIISLLKTADGTADAGTQILKPLDEVTPTEKPQTNQTNQIDQTVPTNKVEPKAPTEQTLIEKLPKTISEIPEGNTGKADQLFREITDGKEEVFVNVYDGGTELKKVKIGEVDELGDFKQSIAEDGRPITEVLDESARNLRSGKKGDTKLSATGDDRAMLKRFSQNRRKEGLLTMARKKKLTSSSDAKLAKTAQDTQAQDYLKSKVERLKEALAKAKSPEEYGRISEQLDEEVSILQNYGKMTPEGRRNILERLQREDPKMTDRIIEDYQGVRETAFQARKREKGSLIKAMESRETRGEKGRLTGSKPVYKGEKDLTTKILQDLEGRSTVSRRYIEDATNRGDIKQAERDLIRRILDDEPLDVNVKDFASKVKSELLPLKRGDAARETMGGRAGGYRYESVTLPDELRGPVANYQENIYNSPIKTSAGDVHFSSNRPSDKGGYFAHSRIEDTPDNTRRVIEIQSDLFQKGRLEGEKTNTILPYENVAQVPAEQMRNNGWSEADIAKALKESSERPALLAQRAKELEKLEPYRNTWHERVIREELKKAAQDGKTKVQFPTGETAMKIEGLSSKDSFFKPNLDNTSNENWLPLKAEDLKVGEMVSDRNYDDWVVTRVDSNGKFQAVPRNTFENIAEESGKYPYPDDALEALQKDTFPRSDLQNDVESFDISGKVDTENPIYKFYEKTVQKYLNKFGGKVVTDKQGVSWVEVPVSKEMGSKPITAFANAAGAGAGFEEGEDGKLRYNAEKGLLGLGLGVAGVKGAKALGKFDSAQYVKQMATQQRRAEGKVGVLANVKSFLSDFKKKVVDTNAPIEDLIAQQQKKLNFEVIPRYDMTNAIDRVYRSTSMAGAFAKENGLEKVIKKVDNLDEFDQYLIAKHGQSLEKEGITTGRNAEKDRMLIEAVGDKYAREEKVVRDYSQKLLNYAVESGLVSKKVAQELKAKYPDYVPYNRIFGEEEAVQKGTGGGVANLGKQSVVQRIKGSEREVQSPMQSFLEKTTDAFHQGEKNKAAQILTSFHNIPDNPFGLEKVGTKKPGEHTISVFKDGQKEIWKVNKDIADAAKALNVEQIGILGKIMVAPVRIAKLGITGINLPFVAANVARDIVSAFVNSKNSFRALKAMPQALYEAVGHQKLYKEMMSEGAMQTSFDIARNQVKPTIRNTRGLLGNKGIEKVKYIASTPAKLFRAVEDVIGRSEELNRISQYKGAYEGAIKKGMTPVDARAVAARASRENSVNFARKGEYGGAMNALVLYLNAGIQGSRTLLRNIKTRPIETGTKIVATVGMPMAITTAWNLSDPKRLEAYKDIPEYEKENNFIFIPPNPTKDENGKWNVIKVPIQPGLSNMVQPIRYALERGSELSPQTFAQMASQLSGAVSPVQVPVDAETTRKTIGQLLPQAIKPTTEAVANKNFFTGADIVPRKLQGLAPELQVKENTSGTSKLLAKQMGASPLQVEHFIKETFGSVGLQFLNVSDRALAKTGKISPDDIGGQDILDAVTARFSKAGGGAVENALWEQKAEASEREKTEKYIQKQDFMPTYNKVKELKKTNPEEAQRIVDNLSEEDYKQYSNIKKAERAKSSTEFKALLRANPKEAVKHLRSIEESDPEEAQRLLDNMDDNEYNLYEQGK